MPDLLDEVVERRWDSPFPRTGRSLYCRRHSKTTWLRSATSGLGRHAPGLRKRLDKGLYGLRAGDSEAVVQHKEGYAVGAE